MQIAVFAAGRKMPAWVERGCEQYTKRLPRRWRFAFREFTQGTGPTPDAIKSKEADSLLTAIPVDSHVVALDQRGQPWSTEELARQLERWQGLGNNVVFLVGGAEGLHERCLSRANQCWSLSELTFPHPLVRVILAEQLYRAQSILDQHPYHRA